MKIARSRALAVAALGAILALAGPSAAQTRIGAPSYGPRPASSHGRAPSYGRAPRAAVIGAPRQVWVPGCMVTEVRPFWVPERIERRWIEPVYELRFDACGNAVQVLIRAGHWSDVCVPGHFESRTVQVWRPGFWQSVYGR